ncbi:FHA domain-containing protein [Kitasatospora aureofaciens]|uniref:FHA domain-containing protein n=1 Tax=Kitasatospora aureofaciens TaxID=1894 RepID=UPI001C46FAAD|nr:FHA domain-containing protein [Kitasatospora aureofaciens]MBV6697836.1 FHA domain-containing protein [Kitasatospora aureofaciens]
MRPAPQQQPLPRLVVDSPEPLRGQVYVVADRPLMVGRDAGCQIHVGDPGISRRHAVVWRSGGHTTVEDLASTNGTRLNGHPLHGQEVLHTGDVIDFGPFEVHYEEPRDPADTVPGPGAAGRGTSALTQTLGPVPARDLPPPEPPQPPEPPKPWVPPEPSTPPQPRYDVERQEARGNLSNVAGNQYNYVMQARRESFFREIAATRTRARHLVLTGFLMFIGGSGVYGWALFSFISKTNDLAQSGNANYSVPDLLGPKVGGVPVGAIGFAVAAIGLVLLVVGIVLHIVTTSRRRRFEDEESRQLRYPPPPQ